MDPLPKEQPFPTEPVVHLCYVRIFILMTPIPVLVALLNSVADARH